MQATDSNLTDPVAVVEPVPNPAPGKPRLRGWSHAVFAPVAGVLGLILVAMSPTFGGRLAAAVYLLTGVLMFGMSGVYHRGHWSERRRLFLRRCDHANIFVFIAGTYTPLAAQLLTGRSQMTLLIVIWVVALAGIVFKLVWLSAPRWLYVLLYLGMGWVAVWWLPTFWRAGGPAVVSLVIAGGLVYSVGAVVYALKRPDPNPAWFGFHEIFHACTIIAALCHYSAIMLATVASPIAR